MDLGETSDDVFCKPFACHEGSVSYLLNLFVLLGVDTDSI